MAFEPSLPLRLPLSILLEEDVHPLGLRGRHEVIAPLAEPEHLGPFLPVELDADPVEPGQSATLFIPHPILRVAVHHHGRLGQPPLEQERTGAEVVHIGIPVESASLQDAGLGRGQQAGEYRVGGHQPKDKAVLSDRFDPVLLPESIEDPAARQRFSRVEHATKTPDHILRTQRGAAVEHRVRPQPEPEGEPILRNGPGFRQGGHHVQRIIEFEQSLVELIHDP